MEQGANITLPQTFESKEKLHYSLANGCDCTIQRGGKQTDAQRPLIPLSNLASSPADISRTPILVDAEGWSSGEARVKTKQPVSKRTME